VLLVILRHAILDWFRSGVGLSLLHLLQHSSVVVGVHFDEVAHSLGPRGEDLGGHGRLGEVVVLLDEGADLLDLRCLLLIQLVEGDRAHVALRAEDLFARRRAPHIGQAAWLV